MALPEHSLRCLYAMSIVRFVNGITDQSQKGRAAIPVATLAEAAGLPRVLVDIRHEAVHNELPSLPLLRMAARQALSWLEANYWTAQKQALLLSRVVTSHNLVQLAVLQGPSAPEPEPTPSKNGRKSGGEEKGSKRKQKTRDESDEKERARLVRELTDVEPENLVSAVLELGLSCGGGEPLGGPDSNHLPAGERRKGADGAGVQDVSKDGWKGAVEALAGKAPFLPSMLLSEAIRRLALQDGTHGAGDIATNGGVAGSEPSEANGGLDWRAELESIVFWLLESVKSNEGSEGAQFSSFGTPLLKELLRRCLVFSKSALGAELVRVLMTKLAEVKTAHVAGGHESPGEATLPAKMQTLLELAAVTGDTPDGSRDEKREGASIVESYKFASAAQKQSELLQALSRQRSSGSTATGSLKMPSRQSDGTSAGDASLERPWSVAKDWAPCALGTIPSPLHPHGRVAQLSRGTLYPSVNPDVLATRLDGEGNNSNSLAAVVDYPGTNSHWGGLPIAELQTADIGCETMKVDRRNLSAGAGTLPEIEIGAESFGRPITTQEFVDGSVSGAVAVQRNGTYVGNSLHPGDAKLEQPGTSPEGVVLETKEKDSKGNEKEGSGVIVDGLCLQGTVQKLSPEQQAHIREAIAIL